MHVLFLISNSSCSFSSVQSLSCVWLFVIPWTAARQASLSITNSQSLLKLMSIESVMPFNHLILCCPLLLLTSIFPTIRVCWEWVSSSPQVCPLQVFLKSYAIKRHLLIGRKALTNIESILKWRDITLLTNVHLVKATVLPAVMYGCESWTVKKAESQRIDAFECGVGEDSWESLGLQGDPTSPS